MSASIDHDALIQLFIGEPSQIIRSSGQCDFDGGLSYQVLMTNPVQQGCIFSSNRTRVLTVDLSDEHTEEIPSLSNASSTAGLLDMLNSPTKAHVIEPQEFDVQILQKKWPEARLYPLPNEIDDDECRVFVNIKDLAKCGVFSGDWVLVSANDPKKSRLCRLYGVDEATTR